MAEEKGTNSLRGGKRTYTAKVLNGNFVEDRFVPAFEGVRPSAETTTRAAELESTHGRVRRYGLGLRATEAKFDDTIDYGNVVEYDRTAGAETWKSVTRSTHGRPTKPSRSEFSSSFHLTAHPLTTDTAGLAEYRAEWSAEGKESASRRFTSQFNRATNPTVAKHHRVTVTRGLPGVPKPVEDFRMKIAERGGLNGIRALGRIMRIMDDSGDGRISRVEFKNALLDFGLDFNETEFFSLFRYFDRDGNNYLDYNEFVRGCRGEMNARRKDIVGIAFEIMDNTGDGAVTVDDLKTRYDTSHHPDVMSGKITRDEALRQFLDMWDTGKKDGIVTKEEFLDHYTDLSASVFDDDEFELIIRNAWHIAGGEGVCENTANLRVLATLEDGSLQVVCVNDDLGLDKTDEAEIIRRLAKQGVVATDVSLNL